MAFPKRIGKLGEKAKRPSLVPLMPMLKDDIITWLRKFNGNISRTADKLGCTRFTLHRIIDKDEDLKIVKEETRERFIDTLEDCSWNKALDGDTTMQLFLLKTIGRKRGYDQNEQTSSSDIAKAAFEFVLNKSKNPAES